MAAPAVMSTLLDTLPPRPPTPPREAAPHPTFPTQLAPAGAATASGPALSNLQTPPGIFSPDSAGSNASSSFRARKKVGFSGLAQYQDPPTYPERNGTHHRGGELQPTPVSLPSSSSKPVKSILKVTTSPSAHAAAHPDTAAAALLFQPRAEPNANLGAMLDSTIQQLAGADRQSRLDAYMTLTQALKASNNLPDRVALQEKMSLFMQFIQRDVTARSVAAGNTAVGTTTTTTPTSTTTTATTSTTTTTTTTTTAVDATLANHALNLLITFLHFPAIASTLSNDFGVFVVDHCIRSFEDPAVPKDVVRRLMQVVAVQNFSPKVINADRVARLVASLHRIDGHLKGKSIVLSRVLIYRKLVKQARQLMALHADWLFDLFTDMLSGLREIRAAAIALGLETAFAIGKEKLLTRKVAEVLGLAVEDKTYAEYYEEKLQAMARERPDSSSVPQIWSVVMLLLRCPFEKWESFSRWLHIIQTCFNSGDFQTKIEANRAWNRLVYLLHVEDRSFARRISLATLSQPLASQLRRRGGSKQMEELRRTVVGGICNLFYYTFKPTTNLTLLDGYWDGCVHPLLRQMLDRPAAGDDDDAARDGVAQATAILTGLFDCVTPRVWTEDRVTHAGLIRPDELPAIDSKWIRRNPHRVFELVEPILLRNVPGLADAAGGVHKLWRALVGTVASAASKEIKVSMDTASFVARAFDLLLNAWRRGPRPSKSSCSSSSSSSSDFLQGILAYLAVMTDLLGPLPFTEKLLSVDKQNHFVPITTPTHRTAKTRGPTKPTVYHLFSIVSTLPPGVPDDDAFAHFFRSAFAPFFAARSDRGRMDLAQGLLSSIPLDAAVPYGPWLLAADNISIWLEASHSHGHGHGGSSSSSSSLQTSASGSETPVGHDYRDVVRVLEQGLRCAPNLPWDRWQALFSSLHERCRDEAGDAGFAIVAVEPLAKSILEQVTAAAAEPQQLATTTTVARCTAELLAAARHPRDRQAVEAARRRLWGTAVSGPRSASFDPFDHLYRLVNWSLVHLYQRSQPDAAADVSLALLKEVGGFLDRANRQLVLRSLASLQAGLCPWIADELADTRRQPSDVVEAVKSLCGKISNILATSDEASDLSLVAFEDLFCAAFGSKHRQIVNTALSLWNSVFEHAEELVYPERLKSVLLSLRPFVDIVLPGLDVLSSVETADQQPVFVDSQDDEVQLPTIPSAKSIRKPSHTPLSASRRSSSPSKRLLPSESTPKAYHPGSARPVPRVRHDDSQVVFATIESSPADDARMESQVLTERQKEVRERQKENAALFPEIRSSSPTKRAKAPSVRSASRPSSSSSAVQPHRRAATPPDAERSFDQFVASTPTPRRGQLVSLPDQDQDQDTDMADPPSSPPEPRRAPLFADFQTRSASSSIMDDWQFSSSPVSGSPANARHAAELPQLSADDGDEDADRVMADADETPTKAHRSDQQETGEPSSAFEEEEDVVQDSVLPEAPAAKEEEEVAPLLSTSTSEGAPQAIPSTPWRRDDQHPAAPRSDVGDVYRTALTSPHERRSQRALRSSAGRSEQNDTPAREDESPEHSASSLLVVELDSGRLDSAEYRQLTVSPDKRAAAARVDSGADDGALDCIVVGESPRLSKQQAKRPTTPVGTAAAAVSVGGGSFTGGSQTRSGSGRRRRRGGPPSSSRKKRKFREVEEQAGQEEEHSQSAAVASNSGSEGIRLRNGRVAKKKKRGGSQIASQPMSSQLSEEATSSSMGGPTQEDTSIVEETEMMDAAAVEDPDLEVQSQLAMEAQYQSARNQSSEPAEQQEQQEEQKEEEEERAVAQPQPAAKRSGPFQAIMSALQSGLETLRTAALSRQEVFKVEDMFMDLRRELYESERRGRA